MIIAHTITYIMIALFGIVSVGAFIAALKYMLEDWVAQEAKKYPHPPYGGITFTVTSNSPTRQGNAGPEQYICWACKEKSGNLPLCDAHAHRLAK